MNATPTTEQLVRVGILVSLTRTRADLLPVDEFGAVPDYFHDGDRRYRLHTKPNSPVAVYSLIDPANEAKLTPALTELVAVADGLPNVSGEIDAQREKMQEAIDALLLANERQAVENHSLRQRAEEADKLREDRRERASRAVQNAINREQAAAVKTERMLTIAEQENARANVLTELNAGLVRRVDQIIEQAGKWKRRALAAEQQAEQDHAEWQTIAAEHARLADVERNLQDTQADLHDARAELQTARKNALEVISNLTQQLPGKHAAPLPHEIQEVHTVINVGDVKDPIEVAKMIRETMAEIPADDPAYTPEEREKIDDWNDHLASAHEQLRLQRLANGTLSVELDQLRAENNGLRADLRVNRAQGVTAQAEEITQLHAQLDQAKRDREETARVADDEIHKQAEHFRAVIQQHVDSAITAAQTVANQRETLEQLRAQLEEIHSGLRDQIRAARMDVWAEVRKAAGLQPGEPRDTLSTIRAHAAYYNEPAHPSSEVIAEANEAIKQLRLELTERLTEIQNLQADLHIAREHAKNVVAKAGRDHAEHVVEIQKTRGAVQLLRNQIAAGQPSRGIRLNPNAARRQMGLNPAPAESPYFPQDFTPGT